MILKNFQLNKINFNNYKFYLLYGKNEGFQNEVISTYFINNFKGEINKYDEQEFIQNILDSKNIIPVEENDFKKLSISERVKKIIDFARLEGLEPPTL